MDQDLVRRLRPWGTRELKPLIINSATGAQDIFRAVGGIRSPLLRPGGGCVLPGHGSAGCTTLASFHGGVGKNILDMAPRHTRDNPLRIGNKVPLLSGFPPSPITRITIGVLYHLSSGWPFSCPKVGMVKSLWKCGRAMIYGII